MTFFAAPRVSPDGRRLAWLTWDHPRMPWDGSELWVADLRGTALSGARRIAGGPEEAVVAPEWSPGGVLLYSSDRTGWWNRATDAARCSSARPRRARPPWSRSTSTAARSRC